MSYGPLAHASRSDPDVSNFDEFVDLVRRVQVPHYEEARRRFGNLELREYMSDSNEVAPYMEASLKDIIGRYSIA